jgi:hypothetical protein
MKRRLAAAHSSVPTRTQQIGLMFVLALLAVFVTVRSLAG